MFRNVATVKIPGKSQPRCIWIRTRPMILGVDVGGTFTDFFLWDGAQVRTAKLPTTVDDQSEAVLSGAGELADRVDALERRLEAVESCRKRRGKGRTTTR